MSSLLDVRTFAIAIGIVSLVLSPCLLLAMRGEKAYARFRSFSLALLCLAAGEALVATQGYLPEVFSVFLGNAAFLGFFELMLDGIAAFLEKRISNWHWLFPTVVIAGPFVYFTFLRPDVNARIIVFSLTSLVYAGVLLRLLLLDVRRQLGRSWILTSTLLFGILVTLLRLGNTVLFRAPLANLLDGGTIEDMGLITGLLMVVSTAIGFIDLALRKAEKARRESEAFSRSMFEAALDGMFIADREGWCLEANPAACALYGCSRDQFLRMSVKDLEEASCADMLKDRIRCPEGSHLEAACRASDGREIEVELSVARVSYAGSPAFLGIARDVGPRRAAERSLRSSELRYRGIFESASVGLIEADLSQKVVGPACLVAQVGPLADRSAE